MEKYRDLIVYISPADEGRADKDGGDARPARYKVRVDSPEGQDEGTFEIPEISFTIAGFVVDVKLTSREATLDGGDDASQVSGASAKEFGEKLYDALFNGDVRSLLDRTTASGRSKSLGTRIRLMMDLEDSGMTGIASLPWELLCRKGKDPLAVSVKTPLVRSLDVAKPTEPWPFQPPLRIMVVMSNPTGSAELDLEEERSRIAREWKELPGVEVEFVRPVVTELREQVALKEYHVVHYMGHGDFDAATGGVLLLENEDRSPHRLSGEEFARIFADEPLRLVFLNACKTGTTGAQRGVHPFAGVATALVKKGVPAVVAMQFPISDQAAIDFATMFYKCIAGRIPVDTAVTEARKVLRPTRSSLSSASPSDAAEEPSEWATPVLYMRAKDGMLFELPTDSEAAKGDAIPAAPDDPWGPGEGDRVFLAATTDMLRPLCRRLYKELARKGVRVIDINKVPPPPYDPKDHAAAVEPLVRAADLCVHLLGDRPGELIDGEVEDGSDTSPTYPLEQCRIGLKAARSQLILLPDIDIEAIEDSNYRTFVDSLIARPRGADRFELVRTGKQQIADEIIAKLQRLKDAREAASAPSASGDMETTAFVDAHRIDRRPAMDVEDFLTERNIEVVMQTSNTSPTDALTQFDVNLGKYPLYVLVVGDADDDWVENRELAAMKSASRSRAKILIGRYLVNPVDTPDDLDVTRSHFEIVAAMNECDRSPADALISHDGAEKA